MTENADSPNEGHDSTEPESEDTTAAAETGSISLTPAARELFLAERDKTCTLCGASPKPDNNVTLHIHHKQPKSEGGTNKPENLAVVCEICHQHHHKSGKRLEVLEGLDADGDTSSGDSGESTEDHPERPLPPQSEPTECDGQILNVIENNGPVRTSDIAAGIDRSTQYTRMLLWKLAGEDLIARTTGDRWDIRNRVNDEEAYNGLPDTPKQAYQAGRDEMIRRMAANNLQQGEIADIADCSRNTVRNAVNRARALAVPVEEDLDISEVAADSKAVASQLRRLARVLDTHDDETAESAAAAALD